MLAIVKIGGESVVLRCRVEHVAHVMCDLLFYLFKWRLTRDDKEHSGRIVRVLDEQGWSWIGVRNPRA